MKEYTATTYIFNENQEVLLLWHKKFNKWMPAGGHVEANEAPHEAALREVKEETGLDVELILDENIWIQTSEASSIPRPYLCLIEKIPSFQEKPPHEHVDFIYLAKSHSSNLKPSDEIKWFTPEEISHLSPDVDVFEDTINILQSIGINTKNRNHKKSFLSCSL